MSERLLTAPSEERDKRARQEQYQDRVHEDGEEQDQDKEQEQSPADEFSSFIKEHTVVLTQMITAQYGLLEVLENHDVLTFEQVSLIQENKTEINVVKQLLKEITRNTLSEKNKEAFLGALDQTDQKHVSNFIRGNGHRVTEYGDDWPLRYCEEFNRMRMNRQILIEITDTRHGLLDEMISVGCINLRHAQLIYALPTNTEINERLYDLLLCGSQATYNAFVHCLLRTGQQHVVHLLQPSAVTGEFPLNDEQMNTLKRNYRIIVHNMDTCGGLLAYLYSKNCLTYRQKDSIESQRRDFDRNEYLLNIIMRGSEKTFYTFLECLNETGQHHLSRILTEVGAEAEYVGAVTHLVATISPTHNREQRERRIVDQLMAHIKDLPHESVTKQLDKVQQRINELRVNDLTIVNAELGHSIELRFGAKSSRGLEYLLKIYSNGQLKSMMQDIFIMLLKTDDGNDEVLDLRIDTLWWDPSNYADSVQKLNLPILFHVYELAKQNQAICDDESSIPIDQFPYELIEKILIQATGHLFVSISRMIPARAELYTLATMMAVSHLWWETLSYRKYIKQLLKRYFKHKVAAELHDKHGDSANHYTTTPKNAASSSSSPQLAEIKVNKSERKQQEYTRAVDVVRPRDQEKNTLKLEQAWMQLMQSETNNAASLSIKQYISESELGSYMERMRNNYPRLLHLIDPENGLLDEMCYTVDCITEDTKEEIDANDTKEKNKYLLKVLMRAGINLDIQNKFIHSLLITSQFSVVYLLAPDIDEVAGVQPITEEHRHQLNQYKSYLKELLSTETDLLDNLVTLRCITERQKESIEQCTNPSKMASILVDTIKRGTEQNLDNFLHLVWEKDEDARKTLHYTSQKQHHTVKSKHITMTKRRELGFTSQKKRFTLKQRQLTIGTAHNSDGNIGRDATHPPLCVATIGETDDGGHHPTMPRSIHLQPSRRRRFIIHQHAHVQGRTISTERVASEITSLHTKHNSYIILITIIISLLLIIIFKYSRTDELYAHSVSKSLERLNPNQRALARWKIQQVLMSVEFPDLDESADQSTDNTQPEDHREF